MFQNIKNFLFIIFISISIFFVIKHYLSEQNIVLTNKSRSSYTLDTSKNLAVLKNDTDNIISYSSDIDDFKKNKKIFKFFELLKKK